MKFTTINLIMDRVTRHPLMQDIPFETIVDYAVEFMKLLGVPPVFEDKIEIIKIKDYRGVLPCDFYDIIQLRFNEPNGLAFRYTTDNFHDSLNKPRVSDNTYKIQGDVIITSVKDAELELSYRAVPLDDDGFPLIPDDSAFSRALELFIKKQWFTIQFDLGKLAPQILQQTQQDYAWAVAQAHNNLIMPSLDKMAALSNMWNRLIDKPIHHIQGFVNEGSKEYIKVH